MRTHHFQIHPLHQRQILIRLIRHLHPLSLMVTRKEDSRVDGCKHIPEKQYHLDNIIFIS